MKKLKKILLVLLVPAVITVCADSTDFKGTDSTGKGSVDFEVTFAEDGVKSITTDEDVTAVRYSAR